jgi:hypothetical protein
MKVKNCWDGEGSICIHQPKTCYTAILGYAYGGLIVSLINCHSTGTAVAANGVLKIARWIFSRLYAFLLHLYMIIICCLLRLTAQVKKCESHGRRHYGLAVSKRKISNEQVCDLNTTSVMLEAILIWSLCDKCINYSYGHFSKKVNL